MDLTKAKRTIRLLQLFKTLRGALLAMPVLVLFFQENGLSQTEIFELQSFFAVAILLLEVPSGYFADRFGHKRSLLLGSVFAVIGFALYGFAYGFWPMLVAEIVLGIGASFISGADSALAYNTLLAVKQEGSYRKYESRGMALSSISEGLASLAGGVIAAAISIRATVLLQVIIYALMIPAVLGMYEPKRHIATKTRHILRDLGRITKYALHGHAEIKWLIFYTAVVGTLTHTMVWLIQPYYQQLSIPVVWFGVLGFIQFLAIAGFALLADRYERLGRKFVFTSFAVIGVLSYSMLALWPSLWILPVLLGFYFIRGVFVPITRDYVNRLVESDIRATVLSVQNLAQKLLYIGIGPLIGWVMDVYSLQAALGFSALFYGSLSVLVLIMMRRNRLL